MARYTLKTLQESAMLLATCNSLESAMDAIRAYYYYPKGYPLVPVQVQAKAAVYAVEADGKRIRLVVIVVGNRFRLYTMPEAWQGALLVKAV